MTNEQIISRLCQALKETMALIEHLQGLPGSHFERRVMIAQYEGHAEMLAMVIDGLQ
jgi:hypothetical protein